MRIDNPYSCDSCQSKKNPSNGWWLLFVCNVNTEINLHPLKLGEGTVVIPWDDEVADIDGVKHLCGIDCVLKAVARELSKGFTVEK